MGLYVQSTKLKNHHILHDWKEIWPGLRNKNLGLHKWRERAWAVTPSGVYTVKIAGTLQGLAGVWVLSGRLDTGLART